MRRIRATARSLTVANVMSTLCQSLLIKTLFLYDQGDDDAAIAIAKESLACCRTAIDFTSQDGVAETTSAFFDCAFALLVNGDRAGAVSMFKDRVCVPILRVVGKNDNAIRTCAATLDFVKRLPQQCRPCAKWVPYVLDCVEIDAKNVDCVIATATSSLALECVVEERGDKADSRCFRRDASFAMVHNHGSLTVLRPSALCPQSRFHC